MCSTYISNDIYNQWLSRLERLNVCIFTIILIHYYWFYYWSLFWDYLLYCLAFCGNQLFEFCCNSTDWLPHDAGSECEEFRNRLLTVLYSFFFCLLVLYFYIAPSRVFFQYVSCKRFRWCLLISIGLLTCIYGIFKFNFILYFSFICSLCFWSYLDRYSFYTFCLMQGFWTNRNITKYNCFFF